MANGCISPQKFAEYLVTQTPVYDREIIRDIRPEDGWIGHVATGVWDPYSGVTHTFDRFRNVQPDVTKAWEDMPSGSCIGAPCDPAENRIGWGWERTTYTLERQSWISDLLCFDQILTVTRAKEHFSQIISDILRPATSRIMSFYLRKRAADHAGERWVADASMTAFTFTWETTGDAEIFMVPTAEPTSKITPQMLQFRVDRLLNEGYLGKMPFRDMPPLIELVTDYNTLWDLDKAVTDSTISDKWRFNDWNMANRYYKYNFRGQLGQYVVRVDPFCIRFNRVSALRYQVVLPFRNVAVTNGIGSEFNPDFQNAQYQWSMIWHREALKILVGQTESVNPLMPFANRSLGGQWQFAMDNLGQDCNGNVIENKRRNKGMFVADFQLAARPNYVEFAELIFHKREPAYVVAVDVCATDPGYPTQYYDSANNRCTDTSLVFTPLSDSSGNYVIAANTVTCDAIAQVHGAVSEATIAALVTTLNAELGALGTWIQSGTQIILTETTCEEVVINWVV